MDLWKALAYLYPAAVADRDYEIEAGDPPRIVRWSLPGEPPTAEQIAAAIVAYDAADTQRQTDAAALRQQVLAVAQSAVGVPFDQLTAAQLRALFGVVLRKENALDKDGKVRPLAEWVK